MATGQVIKVIAILSGFRYGMIRKVRCMFANAAQMMYTSET
jgi:hypothetical protein